MAEAPKDIPLAQCQPMNSQFFVFRADREPRWPGRARRPFAERENLLYPFLIAVIVALGVKMVGGLLTAALVAVSPSAARNVSKNLRQYYRRATAFGVASAVLGIVLHRFTGLPAGPLIIVVSAVIFAMTLPFAG